VAGKFSQGHGNFRLWVEEKRVYAILNGSRFRETYFFSAGKKSKQKTPRLRLVL